MAAREAMEAEEPLEAIQIASTIPGHLESLGSLEKEAARALKEAEQALSAVSDDISHDSHERLKESKAAFDSGDFSLSKGISESISRDIRGTGPPFNFGIGPAGVDCPSRSSALLLEAAVGWSCDILARMPPMEALNNGCLREAPFS